MSDEILKLIITNVFGIISTILIILVNRKVNNVQSDVKQVKTQTDGLLDKLTVANKAASFSEGKLEGQDKARAEIQVVVPPVVVPSIPAVMDVNIISTDTPVPVVIKKEDDNTKKS